MTEHEKRGDLAVVVCGALAPQVRALIDRHGGQGDIYALSALHHLEPDGIVEALDRKLAERQGRYETTLVVYGDCGTGGRIDEVIDRYGAVRPAGLHCFELLAGERFRGLADEEAGTYFLTPWMVRTFERTIMPSLGLTEHPELIPEYFGNYTRVVYLRDAPDAELDRRAERVATLLGLRLEIEDTGLDELERRLIAADHDNDRRSARWSCMS